MEVDGLDAVCAGLGCPSQDPGVRYIKGEHCIENLKHLQRFLRRDHPINRPVFRQLGKWNTVGRDLVPIVCQYRDDLDIVINAVKVVVFLTMPLDHLSENVSQQVDYMVDFKSSFLHNDAIAVIMTLLEEPLEHLESHNFSEDDWKVVQLVLTLIRNLLEIEDMKVQKFTAVDNAKSLFIRDNLLQHLFEENVMDLLLALAFYISGPVALLKQDSLLFLEIFHHIFWGQSPEIIARANEPTSKDTGLKQAGGRLREMAKEEQEQLRELRLKELSRHSRFSGSFIRLAEDGSRRLLKRNPFQSSIDTVLRGPRFKHGPVKRVACDRISSITPESKIVELLKSLADQILSGSYNVVMQTVKDDISRERNGIQSGDVILFFEVAKFFTAYQRHKFLHLKKDVSKCKDFVDTLDSEAVCLFQGKLCGPIASTMDVEMFMMVISRWHTYAEGAKETNDWQSLSVTGSLFREMIRLLDVLLKDAKDREEPEQEVRVARILLYKIFYDQTENGTLRFLLHLLKSFDIHKQPRSHLVDLIETVHVVLRIIEFLTKEDGALRVLKKSRRPSRKKIKSKNAERISDPSNNHTDDPSERHITDSNSEINKVNQSPSDIERTISKQANESACVATEGASKEISDSNLLSNDKPFSAGTAEYPVFSDVQNDGDAAIDPLLRKQDATQVENDDDSDEETKRDTEEQNVEVSLDPKKCSIMFVDNTVIRNYCWILKSFMSNTAATNHYILCMLQKICKDHDLEPMLFQLSLFETFYEILSNKKASKLEEHKRLYEFLTKLVRNFFKKLKTQPLLFLDVLFWKTRHDCHLITMDYELHSLKNMAGRTDKKSVSTQSNRGGNDGDHVSKRSLADALGDDEADAGPWGSIDETGNGMQIDNDPLAAEKPRRLSTQRRKSGLFTLEQETQLQELFEQYKENPKCCQILADAVDSQGKITALHVRRKLKSMNLSPPLQRRRMNKQTSDHVRKSKKAKIQTSADGHTESDNVSSSDGVSSGDETLNQLMQKVRASGRTKVSQIDVSVEHLGVDENDESNQNLLAKRKRVRLSKHRANKNQRKPISSSEEIEEERQSLSLEGASFRSKDDHARTMELDKTLEDDISEDMHKSLDDHSDGNVTEIVASSHHYEDSPILPEGGDSQQAPASMSRRRRNLYMSDDEDNVGENVKIE